MKRLFTALLTALILSAIICIGVGASSYDFGYATGVLSNDVNIIKTGLIGKKITFTDGDFKSALCLTDFDSITVTKIPSSNEGALLLGGRRVSEGRVIKRRNIGSLVFVPASNEIMECSFAFTVDGYAGGAQIECILKFIDRVNYAPSTEGESVGAMSLKTQEGVISYGNLTATDPEGDALKFIIVSYPKRGYLELIDDESGRYSYEPEAGYTGNDKFSYVVRDEFGNYSEAATVSLKVNARMCEVSYYDMENRAEYNAALAMTAMGVMNGRVLGDGMYFEPDKSVSRAEFVAMAMKTVGLRPDSTIRESFFDDNSEIPSALRGYIATAQRLGIVSGDFKDGKLLFSPNEEITRYEAAKILSSLLGTDTEGEESVFATDENIPVWARAGVYAMRSLGVYDSEACENLSANVTRADAASFLYRLAEL